jgi:hypothetical protein
MNTPLKVLLLVIAILFIALVASAQCPPEGDNVSTHFREASILKNRTAIDTSLHPEINVADFLVVRNDATRWNDTMYVTVRGYIVGVKWGGKEICNCHSPEKDDGDIHIELAANASELDKTKMMVVEMTRFSRHGADVKSVKKLLGKMTLVTGWLFYDSEHWQNAKNTNPAGTNLWRGTAWEVHPVMNIVEVK